MGVKVSKFWVVPPALVLAYGAYLFYLMDGDGDGDGEVAASHIPNKVVPEPQLQGAFEKLDEESEELRVTRELREELERIETRILRREQLNEERALEKGGERVESLDLEGLTPDQWTNAGRETPERSVETFLFAGASGDVELMVDSILIEGGTRDLAIELFEGLPIGARGQYPSYESLVAALVVDDVPLTLARLLDEKAIGDGRIVRNVLFTSNIDPPKIVKLQMRKARDDSWKIVVPDEAIRKYAGELLN